MAEDETVGTMACTTGALAESRSGVDRKKKRSEPVAWTPIVDAALTAFVFGLAAAVVVGGGLPREDLETAAAGFSYAGGVTLLVLISRSLNGTSRDRSSRLVPNRSSRWPRSAP